MPANSELTNSAEAVCDAVRNHASTCQQTPDDASAVVAAGETLVQAMLMYEEVLGRTSGWSNPVRHLGPLPFFGRGFSDDSVNEKASGAVFKPGELGDSIITIEARYRIRVSSRDDLVAFVNGRFGTDLSDHVEAIETLYKSESWDPRSYPPSVATLHDAHVEVTAAHPADDDS